MRCASEPYRWDPAGIKRAAKAVADRQAGKRLAPRVTLPRSDVAFAIGAEGRGVTYTDMTGRVIRAQVWAPAQYVRTYWYAVVHPVFPGEMRLVTLAKDGTVERIDPDPYNARGERAHAHDGSACYGAASYARGGCPGCNEAKMLPYVGRQVCVREHSTTSLYGATVHLGLLQEVRDGRVWLDSGESVSLGAITSIEAVAA